MEGLQLSLDHIGAMTVNLDRAAALWRRLGFTLAPRSQQMGKVPGQKGMRPWATANHCAMLRTGYLELIGIHAPENFNPWVRQMERYEGIHIMAFRCDEADAAHAVLRRRSIGLDPPVDRRRQAPYGEGAREMRFRNIFSQDDAWPEGRIIVIEHQTPEAIWRDELMVHPNGATGLAELVVCVADKAASAGRFNGLLGVPPLTRLNSGAHYHLPRGGLVTLLDHDAFRARFPGAFPPALPAPAAITVTVEDLEATRDYLVQSGVAPREGPDGRAWVHPEDTGGFVMALAEAPCTALVPPADDAKPGA